MRTIPALAISLSRQDGAPLALMGTRRYAARQTPNAREKNAHKALCYETMRTGRKTPLMDCRGRMTFRGPDVHKGLCYCSPGDVIGKRDLRENAQTPDPVFRRGDRIRGLKLLS